MLQLAKLLKDIGTKDSVNGRKRASQFTTTLPDFLTNAKGKEEEEKEEGNSVPFVPNYL